MKLEMECSCCEINRLVQTEAERRRREVGVKQSMEIRLRSCMYVYTGWAEKNVPNFKAILLLNCTAEKVQIWMV